MLSKSSYQRTAARDSSTEDQALALGALAWTLSDGDRAERLLSLTGLDPAELRARAGEPALLAAVIGFLTSHEPDLIACAAALDTTPAHIASLQDRLA